MTQPCGCCRPPVEPTPFEVENRPALSAIVYRIGTYASFREAMLLGIANQPEVSGLTTRSNDDYGITLLDLWAAVADVLTFYQERYANEAFLRTATFRDSILKLTNLIGYRLRPGSAARASVAFTLDKSKAFAIPAGQKVQSVPAAGQQPQTFETLSDFDADARWNRLRIFPTPANAAQLAQNRTLSLLDRLQGPSIAAALAPNDNVVLFNNGASSKVEEKKIASLRVEDDRVTVAWTAPVRANTWGAATEAFQFRRVFRLYGINAPEQTVAPFTPDPNIPTRILWRFASLTTHGTPAGNTIDLDARYDNVAVGRKLLIDDTANGGTKTLVTVNSVRHVNPSLSYATAGSSPSTFSLPSADTVTEVDVIPDDPSLSQVPAAANRRSIVIYELESTPIVFAAQDYAATLRGDSVFLPGVAVNDALGAGVEVGRTIQRNEFQPGVVFHLTEVEKGRPVLLSDATGAVISGTIKSPPSIVPAGVAPGSFCHLKIPLALDSPLALGTASAYLLGNVAPASHGETVLYEAVGSGDASMSFQRFPLKKKPLTWLSGGTAPNGLESTLNLRVDGVTWTAVPQLFGQSGASQVYELRTADDGTTTIQFGDGNMGALVPTGRNNLVATYRVGSGLAGRVPANALTTLLQKPAGLLAATNPVAADGGADSETLAEARTSAPRTVRTFGRIVSLRDFEDQATASGEVAKALATSIWDGLDRAIHLTVAGQQGATFSDQGRRNLGDQLKLVRDANHRLRIANYARVSIQLRAGIQVDARYSTDAVVADATARVLDFLSFDNLRLGQMIGLSDLYRVLQDTPGVVFADIDLLQFKRPPELSTLQYLLYLLGRGVEFGPTGPKPVQGRLRIFLARPAPGQPGVVLPAELASVESPTQDVTIEVRA
jgi:hypothetical protein